jgi:hypothetical protein
MGHGKATFKQADLTRALRAVEKAGRDVARAEIARDGRIVLVFKNGEEVLVEQNEWDDRESEEQSGTGQARSAVRSRSTTRRKRSRHGRRNLATHVIWDSEHVEVTATEAMEAAESGAASARERRKEAEEFLKSRLAAGPVPTKDIEEEAKAHGISVSGALKRARKDLGVRVGKQPGKMDSGWLLELPEVPQYDRD